MIVQKFVVLLAETTTGCDGRSVRQIWLGYNAFGRIGNCLFSHAFRYDSQKAAEHTHSLKRSTSPTSLTDTDNAPNAGLLAHDTHRTRQTLTGCSGDDDQKSFPKFS